MFKEFKEFALRGNVIDLAIGIIIGAAFTSIVNSFVNDIIMPAIGMLIGQIEFQDMFLLLKTGAENPGPYTTLADAQAAGAVTVNYGMFINNVINFLIVAFVIFMLVRGMNRLYKKQQQGEPAAESTPTTKPCPYCKETVALAASRCPHCTSELAAAI